MSKIMKVHVRGHMGVQVLQAFVGLSDVRDDEYPIICANTDDLPYDGSNRLHELMMPMNGAQFISYDGNRKTPYWVPGAATKAFKNRDRAFAKWFDPIIDPIIGGPVGVAVHVRGTDKPVASYKSNVKLIRLFNDPAEVTIYSDDYELSKKLARETKTRAATLAGATYDWNKIYHSAVVYGCPSAYLMSMLLFNPLKAMVFGGESYCDGGYQTTAGDFIFLREAMEFCPNVMIVN